MNATQVAHPGTVGLALGSVEWKESDAGLLPKYLDIEDKIIRDFVGNFVWGRYWLRGWLWVESVPTDKWTADQKVTLYTFLPFGFETWRRAEATLGEDYPADLLSGVHSRPIRYEGLHTQTVQCANSRARALPRTQ